MERIAAWRVEGRCELERPAEGVPEPVTIELTSGVEVRESAMKRRLLYQWPHAYGVTLEGAIQRGWCRVVEGRQADGDEPPGGSWSLAAA